MSGLLWVTRLGVVCVLVCSAGAYLSELGVIPVHESVFHATNMVVVPVLVLSSGAYLHLLRRSDRTSDGSGRADSGDIALVRLTFLLAGGFMLLLVLMGIAGSFALS